PTLRIVRPACGGSSTGVIAHLPPADIFEQNSSRDRGVRDDTYTWVIDEKIAVMPRSDHTPSPPHPTRPSVAGGRGARCLAATAAHAAVRRNVMVIPSMMQHGSPCSGLLRMIMAFESGNPRSKLPGK